MSFPILLFLLLQIRHYSCSDEYFPGFDNMALIEPRLSENRIYEHLIAISDHWQGPREFPMSLFEQDLELLAEAVACQAPVLEAFSQWFWNHPQGELLSKLNGQSHAGVFPETLTSIEFEVLEEAYGERFRYMGRLFAAKARVCLHENDPDQAATWLAYSLHLAAYLTTNPSTNSLMIARAIYFVVLPVLAELPTQQIQRLLQAETLPSREYWIGALEKAYWDHYLKMASHLRNMGNLKGLTYERFVLSKILGINVEAVIQLMYEDLDQFRDQLPGQWMQWEPTAMLSREKYLIPFSCDFMVDVLLEIIVENIERGYVDALGFTLIRVDRFKLESRLKLLQEPTSRENVERVLQAENINNPFTLKPYRLGEKGDFLIQANVDVSPRSFSLNKELTQPGLVFVDEKLESND